MANDIKVTLRVSDDGSLTMVSKNAAKAAASTENLNSKKNSYNKLEKGTAGLTSNSTKAFAKQAQAMGGGLVPAYATLAANVFAVTAAFGVLQRSAAVKQLEEGLIFTGRAAGANLPLVVRGLKEITGSAVSTADAMRSVAVGVSAGFSQSQMEGLARTAKGASLALGRDMADAMDRLTRGAAKLEPEILDELGIMVRLDDATETYAATLGKTANELSNFERRMAFTNAIIEQGDKKFAALAAVVDPNPYDKLAASFDNLVKIVLNGLNTAFGPIVGVIADNLGLLVGLVGVFATGVIKQAIPALTSGGNAAAAYSAKLADSAKEQIAATKTFKGAPKVFDNLVDSIKNGTATQKQMKEATTSLNKSINIHNGQMDEFTKKHKAGSKAVIEKTAKLNGAKLALQSITQAQILETQATLNATKADTLNAAAQGQLSLALTLNKAALMQEWAATMTNAAGKGLLTKMMWGLIASFKIATFSARVLGLALLNMIPVLGQIIMVASLAYSFLKDLFVKPPTKLQEALDEARERLDEFPKVLNQMVAAFSVTETAAAGFMAALKPTSGILQQITDATTKLISVQQNEKIEAQVKARVEMINAGIKLAEAQDKVAKSSQRVQDVINVDTSEMTWWEKLLLWSSQGAMIQGAMASAAAAGNLSKKSMEELAEATATYNASIEDMNNLDGTKTLSGMREILARGVATFQVSKGIVAGNAEAMALLDEKIAGVNNILENLTEDNLPEALKQLQELNNQQQATAGSAEAATKAVTAFTELFAKRGRPVGLFAEDLNLMATALKDMEAGKKFEAIMAQYQAIFDKYNLTNQVTFETFYKNLVQISEAQHTRAVDAEKEARSRQTMIASGQTIAAQESALASATADKAQRLAELEGARSIGLDTRAYELAYEKAITDEIKEQLDLMMKKTEMVTRTGGETMGAASEFSDIASTITPETGAAAGLASLNAASQSTLDNLKKLGPEGEASAAIIGGALNMAEVWSSTFDTIKEAGDDTSAKLTAGMQAVGATINAIGKMQQANAKAKVAAVDKEIAAEQKKDGKSAASMAKIAALEKKKDAIKRKAFEQNKKMQMAEVVMATGVAIMNSVKMGLPWGLVFGTMAAAMGAAQLSAIASTSYDGGGTSAPSGPSAISMGQRNTSVDLAKSQGAAGELSYLRGAQGMGGAENFRPTNAFTGAKYRASGGNTAYMVGEQGPELFVPDRSGQIMPADETAAGGQSMNVNFSINAVDASGIEDLLVGQRGNIIGMLREAANSTGDLFMEQVDTGQYTPSSGGVRKY